MTHTLQKHLSIGYDEALAKVTASLKEEGFGVLTQIDVRDTLRQKLGVEFRRYMIFGACNPPLAHRALTAALDVGVMLPCNVVVYENPDGKATVVAIDPMQTIAATEAKLAPIAAEVRDRLARVLAALP